MTLTVTANKCHHIINKYTCIFFLIATNVSLECAATKCDVADFNTREDDSQSGMHYKFTAICSIYIYI